MEDVKRVVYMNAGHWLNDRGTSFDDELYEFIETIRIRDALVPKLEEFGFEVHQVPDTLDLRQSIDWVNARTKNINDGLALDIHLNANLNTRINGVEAYHYPNSSVSYEIGKALASNLVKYTGIDYRGVYPDTWSAAGSLGWIRQTTPWAGLVEVFYLSNEEDREKYKEIGPEGIAQGIAYGVLELFGPPSIS